jgi:transcription antitermination protein NusB
MPTTLRHQARILAMQALYEWDTATHDVFDALERLADEQVVPSRAVRFARELVVQVVEHLANIDERLAAAAPRRPLAQMARVEKAILRLAISEILLNNGVPARAAIHEAVELAKEYGGEHSASFVNGVLGTIFSQTDQPSSPPSDFESEETP